MLWQVDRKKGNTKLRFSHFNYAVLAIFHPFWAELRQTFSLDFIFNVMHKRTL